MQKQLHRRCKRPCKVGLAPQLPKIDWTCWAWIYKNENKSPHNRLMSPCTTINLSPYNPLSPTWAINLSPYNPLSPTWARWALVPILTWARWFFIQTWKYSPQKRTEAARCTSIKLKAEPLYQYLLEPACTQTWKYSPQKCTEPVRCTNVKLKDVLTYCKV